MSQQSCDRTAHCLNFRRIERTYCDACGTLINMNHYHSSSDSYRLCDTCFRQNLQSILSDQFVPQTPLSNEIDECLNQPTCFTQQPYSMYQEKLCDICGKYPAAHYHDIQLNKRFCLQCFIISQGKS